MTLHKTEFFIETTLFILFLSGLIACNVMFNIGDLARFKIATQYLLFISGLILLNSAYTAYDGGNFKIAHLVTVLFLYSPIYIVGALLFIKGQQAMSIDDVASVILPSQIIGYIYVTIYLAINLQRLHNVK